MPKLLNILMLLLILALMCPAPLPVQALTGSENKLLQYTGGGHVLGFSEGEFYVATGDHALKVEFVNGLAVQPVAESTGSGQDVAPLDKVAYNGIWQDIDIVYTHAANGIVESTYYLNTPASVDDIRLRYNRPVSLDGQGNLVISFENGNMVESTPVAWQDIAGQRTGVQANYVIYGEHEVGFALAGCRPGVAVTIDPTLAWNTFLGGNRADGGNAITVDAWGNIYISGTSNATWGNPVRAYSDRGDAFVARIAPSGALVWHTFLGGDERDNVGGIVLDHSGHIYVTGTSSATWGSPIRAFSDHLRDAFAAKLDINGNLIWNTFLGGGSWSYGNGIAADTAGNVYVTGDSYGTWGSPVREHSESWHDAFVAKLESGGNLIWNTFLGGIGDDFGNGIVATAAGKVYVVGKTDKIGVPDPSWGAPVRAYSLNDVFVAGLNSNGVYFWNTFLGGSDSDIGQGIAVDAGGNLYVCGSSSSSWGSPIRAFSGYGDAFVSKLTSSGILTWNTFLGGDEVSNGSAIAVDADSNVYIAGASSDTWGTPVRPFSGGDWDGFAAKLTNSGYLLWNTFLGGNDADFSNGVAVDSSCNVYIAGASYGAWGSPVRPYTPGTGGWDSSLDAFVAKILGNAPSITSFTPRFGDSRTVVTITGRNFIGATVVSFAGVPTTDFNVDSSTQITATVGTNATGKVRVTTPAGTAVSVSNFYFESEISEAPNGGASMPGGTASPPQSPVILPSVSVRSASLSAARVAPGTAITVTADVVNTGTVNGSSSIKVYVNGGLENSQGVTVKSGSSMPVTFNVSRDEPGTYSVYVNGVPAGSFTVELFTNIDILVYGVIGLFAIGIVWVLYLLLRRRPA